MPLYEFSCKSCGKRFEKLLRSGETELPPCPACGSSDVGREVSGFAEVTPPGCSPGGG
ncbi:FmdB family zinc ribbon protein [Geomonas sp. RF6]|uniref:FmdB family zinc ribbon protein n=1 Tax=Geomonas sp. RF6 TaxID=2897342 RepID=UPI003FA57415